MTSIFQLDQILEALEELDPVESIEEGFIAYSKGNVVVPPVAELLFADPPGDVHIKYGYIKEDDVYVIKIASGFYPESSGPAAHQSGLMLVFRQKTGALECILLDNGHLTNVRTAAAGAVVAKYLSPGNISCIGIVGAGVQARMQLSFLRPHVSCSKALVWGQTREELEAYTKDMRGEGFQIRTTMSLSELAGECNYIVTATPSKSPLLSADTLRKGTHITAVGSDTPEKQELDSRILERADIVVADSISQCLVRGEIHKAVEAGYLDPEKVRELGHVILDKSLQRRSDEQLTVADLTGVAVQDIQISKAVYQKLRSSL